MHNLFRLASGASRDGQMGKWPRLDPETLSTYSEGLIATSRWPSGEIQTRLRLGHFEEAVRAAGEYQDMFGKDNYFIELMDHGLSIEQRSEERREGKRVDLGGRGGVQRREDV